MTPLIPYPVTAKVRRRRPRRRQSRLLHVFDLPDDVEPGDAAIAEARRRAGEFAAKWQSKYPGAVACVTDDLAWLTTFLRFPRGHWRRIRHTNLIERTFNQG